MTLTPLEMASGIVVGRTGRYRRRPAPVPAADPVAALEAAVAPALRRSPCLVSFSGGQDSSLVLAAAMRVARREKLPLPVPVTWRVRDAPLAEESAWQELAIRSLEIPDWIRLEADDDLDFVGPVATGVLRRHGVVHPSNAHLHAPLLAQAGGGTLLTGLGGDQVLGPLTRPRRPVWWPWSGGPEAPLSWLRPAAARRVRADLRCERRARPPSYEGRPDWARTRRDLSISCQTLELLGHDTDTVVVNPLLDPTFLLALCRSDVSPAVLGGRSRLIGRVWGGVYPEPVLRFRPKATFGEVFWRRPTRSLLAEWSGTGVDEALVDPARLRQEWDRPNPDLGTATLVQQVWLARAVTSCTGVPA